MLKIHETATAEADTKMKMTGPGPQGATRGTPSTSNDPVLPFRPDGAQEHGHDRKGLAIEEDHDASFENQHISPYTVLATR